MRPRPAPDAAISAAQFAAAMAPFRLAQGSRIAVAVSGGPDSMALVRLLAEWSVGRKIAVFALTVNHQLRAEAAAEASQVGAWLDHIAIPHTVLCWEGGPCAGALARSAQSAARDARYGLMTAWSAANACTHLFVAHHADDQVETFLLRLSRGSGLEGLAAMAPSSLRDGIVVARPLLNFTKTQLLELCRGLGQPWIEDPSNASAASARVRFRQSQALLEREGLTRDRLLATIGHLQRARDALDQAVDALLAGVVRDGFGLARLPVAAVLAVPEEIALRGLSRLLTVAGGQTYGPRFESLARLYQRLTAGPWSDATLHGCLLSRDGEVLVIGREPAQIDDEKFLYAPASVVWDGRFRLTLHGEIPAAGFRLARLTADSYAALTESQRANLALIPARVRETLPALYDAQGLAAVPHGAYCRPDVAAIPGFSLGVVSISAENSVAAGP